MTVFQQKNLIVLFLVKRVMGRWHPCAPGQHNNQPGHSLANLMVFVIEQVKKKILHKGDKASPDRYQKNPATKAKFAEKLTFFLRGDFAPFISKSFQVWHHFFPLFLTDPVSPGLFYKQPRKVTDWLTDGLWKYIQSTVNPKP